MTHADALHRIRACADLSIRRALGFALLAVLWMAAGLSFDLAIAAKTSAIETMLIAVVLVLKAMTAEYRDYRRTEVWTLLDQEHHLPEARAQSVIGGVLKERYWKHAEYAGIAACVCWLLTFGLQALRPTMVG
ncbi:MAG: hypothetical protein EAZ99_18595 [Alphaproteobacteria bacterium]|nr:hypothetical protein [Alphaproteobacteria bacterium]TAD87121.1 MAG: hypothetical protein EAZ99_18595 [Alphaproteobacteria bacterium]